MSWLESLFYIYSFRNATNSRTMLGVVRKITDKGLVVLVNDKPYYTSKKFIPFKKIKLMPKLRIGSKICYDDEDQVIELSEYLNCKKCHKTMRVYSNHVCNCEYKDMVDTDGELIKTEYKIYNFNIGFKVYLKTNERVLHAVLFENNPLFDIMEEFKIGDKVYFKALIRERGIEHDLVNIFHVQNFK